MRGASREEVNATCHRDAHCPGRLICYREASWSKEKNFCDCAYSWGWEGEECVEFEPYFAQKHLHVYIEVILCGVLLALALRDSFDVIKRSRLRRKTPVLETWVFSSFGILFFLLNRCFYLWDGLHPEEFGKEDARLEYYTNDKVPRFYMEQVVFSALTSFCSILALLGIGLAWLEVSYKSQKFQARIGQDGAWFKKYIRSLQLLAILAVCVAFFFERGYMAVEATSFVASLVIPPMYFLARIRLKRTLQYSEQFGTVLRAVMLVSRRVIICEGITIVGQGLLIKGLLTGSSREYMSSPRSIRLNNVAVEIINWGEMCCLGLIFLYVHSLMTALREKLVAKELKEKQKSQQQIAASNPNFYALNDPISLKEDPDKIANDSVVEENVDTSEENDSSENYYQKKSFNNASTKSLFQFGETTLGSFTIMKRLSFGRLPSALRRNSTKVTRDFTDAEFLDAEAGRKNTVGSLGDYFARWSASRLGKSSVGRMVEEQDSKAIGLTPRMKMPRDSFFDENSL